MTIATFSSEAIPFPARKSLALFATFCAIAVLTAMSLGLANPDWISLDLLIFLLFSTVFVGLLCVSRSHSGVASLSNRKTFLSATVVIWSFLLTSEGIFVHIASTQSAAGGQINTTAIFEALSWMLSFVALAFITCFRPAYLRQFFSRSMRWATIFAIIAVISCPLSPNFGYSLTLAFKLSVVVMTVVAISECIEGDGDARKLLAALLASTLVLCLTGFALPFLQGGPLFHGTRFGVMIGLSGISGILLILTVLFWLLKKSPWFLAIGVFAVVLMILAGGKGGIAASILSFGMFFLLLKKPAQALAACLLFTLILVAVLLFTPVGNTLQSYSQSENATTLTGRTNLWTAVWPEIKQRPIFGHGYRASRFVSTEVEGAFAEAGHVHNVFLEILYNNGIAGLFPILMLNAAIVSNLRRALTRPSSLHARYIGAAAAALYVHLLLWGVTAPTFGSAADSRFMTFFFILLVSMVLRSEADNRLRAGAYDPQVA